MNYFLKYFLSITFLVTGLHLAAAPQPSDLHNQKILLAILARNKEHVLPYFLQCIENLDYPKQLLTLYVNTNNNCDNTEEVLTTWIKKHEKAYHHIIYEKGDYSLDESTPHEWTPKRLRTLANIRNTSLQKTKEYQCDYYFVVDCDNFIAPFTLKELLSKDRPIIAPMLTSIPERGDVASNFFCDVTETGYYKDHPDYFKIWDRVKVGTFKVPLVHCTYLIKAEYLDKLSYTDGNSEEYEFIIFSRHARNHGIDQYICNEKEFGHNLNFFTKLTLEEEKARVSSIPRSLFMLPDQENPSKGDAVALGGENPSNP